MNIIDKLGIECLIHQQAEKMLSWLIKDLYIQDVMELKYPDKNDSKIRAKYGDEITDHLTNMYQEQKAIIEESTGLSWEDIYLRITKLEE